MVLAALLFLLLGVFVLAIFDNFHATAPKPPGYLLGKSLPNVAVALVEDSGQVSAQSLPLSNLEGPAVVNFWASWCLPCHREHRLLADLAAAGAQIYGINYIDTPAQSQLFLRRLGNPFTLNLTDPNGVAGVAVGVLGMPTTVVIDGAGQVRQVIHGELLEDSTDYRQLQNLLFPAAVEDWQVKAQPAAEAVL